MGTNTARKTAFLEDRLPLLYMKDEATTVTKGGFEARIVELRGRDYSGLDDDMLRALFLARKQLFDSLPGSIVVRYNAHRLTAARGMTDESFSVPLSAEISRRWGASFASTYRTRHFLVFETANNSITDQLQLLLSRQTGSATAELSRELDDYVSAAITKLEEYGPRLLQGDEAASYWAWLVNGRHVQQRVGDYGLLNGFLAGCDLAWPARKRHQVYQGATDLYSAWLVIKAPAQTTKAGLLDSLFKIPAEFTFWQTFTSWDKQAALNEIDDKQRNVVSWGSENALMLLELAALKEKIEAEELALLSHRYAIEVFGDTLEGLEESVRRVRQTVESWGYRVGRETVNQEALWWSRFPEKHTWNVRVRDVTSENAAHFATFATVGEGLDSCSWGDYPVTWFRTTHGSEYSFTFHKDAGNRSLGHLLVVGQSNSGKTTLLSFLLSQCFKYPNFRAICFDRLQGMRVFTETHGGDFLDFGQGVADMNPLQLPDTSENRAFLQTFMEMLAARTDDESKEVITSAIRQAYTLERKERTLPNIADAFGLKSSGSIRQAMDRWLPDGAFGHLFCGNRDALSFDRALVTFDMTVLLDMPDVLGPVAYYMFHRIFQAATDEGGLAVFIDEFPRYGSSPVFAPWVDQILQEIRKKDGVAVLAAQTLDGVLKMPNRDKILNNMAGFLLYPEPMAKWEDYEAIGLTATEFKWIKDPHHRQVLLKRNGGESVVLDIDLAPLGPLLRAFNSGSDEVLRLRKEKEKGGDWKKRFLGI